MSCSPHFLHFPPQAASPASSNGAAGGAAEEVTLCTRRRPGARPQPRADRPALVVSSTSWTPDEDFGTLLAAVRLYDAQVGRHCFQSRPDCPSCVSVRPCALHASVLCGLRCVVSWSHHCLLI